jgi:hypothetical protein
VSLEPRRRQSERDKCKVKVRKGRILSKSDELIKDSASKRQIVKRKRRTRRQKASKEVSKKIKFIKNVLYYKLNQLFYKKINL